MRKLLLLGAIVVLTAFATPAQACEDCADYFDYQSLTWCLYCEREVDCGFFNCRIEEMLGQEYCTGDDGGCFTDRSSDYCGPDEESSLQPAQRLDRKWRLTRVKVTRPPAVASIG